ncbi:E3 ubiquitin-protein ligase RNF181 isoform X1 [Narcine bancroftii]|uniref:E3 ubiquitin-protein ligase RNF181 isoform X1 n=1 Tax=Narcine bancroftii TaxID=1343680 RepID=UPI0038316E2F
MTSYFEEHNCEPTNPEEQYRQNTFLELARSLLAGIDIDLGQVDFSDWDHRLPPAAKKEIVQNLPTLPVTPTQADRGLKCPVCLLEFEDEELVKKMPCEHFFHSGCIVPWLGKTNSCPLCRLELPTDNEEYEEYKQEKGLAVCDGTASKPGGDTVTRNGLNTSSVECCEDARWEMDFPQPLQEIEALLGFLGCGAGVKERRKQKEQRLEYLHDAMYT